ncbi:MAG: B12-binding domain-containing radical SAM protein [Chlorobi bacterium]|nr:B12-binding domain-containing radical SAM protein [Chlorobiota bacterium]
MQKRKLVLINPRGQHRQGFVIDKESRYPPLGLAIVAALTPDDWEIVLKDENFEDFEHEHADLVGITSFTSTVTRAYEIADEYTSRNTPVVLGGIHASMLPDEALRYVDVVAVGEAESTWPRIIADFENGELKKTYSGELINLKDMPRARHDLYHDGYVFDSIQTTRGCPMQCEFCSVHSFNGRAYRMRPVEDVLDEMEIIKAPNFMIVDDNIVGYNKPAREHAKSVFKGMLERGIKKDWFCQASINFGEDEELLQLAADAGCRLVLIGVESEKTDALESMKKRTNLNAGVHNYQKIFAKIQSYGISVLGTFIFGLDTDDIQDLRNRMHYIMESNVNASQVSVLTPFPGTATYDQFVKEGRLLENNFPADWEKYWGGEVVIQPKKMSLEEMKAFKYELVDNLYNYKRLMMVLKKTLKTTKNAKAAVWAFSANAHYRNMAFEHDESKQIKVNKLFGSLLS